MIDRLNRLDERTGLGQPPTRRRWDRSIRFWWLGPAFSLAFIGILQWLSIAGHGDQSKPIYLPVLLVVNFYSGFFYAHRLKRLGITSGNPALREPEQSDEDRTT